jgi:hypothetical protein
MNVEIGAEATLFPEKVYIKGIFVAVYTLHSIQAKLTTLHSLITLLRSQQ